MGWQLGRLMKEEVKRFLPAAVAGFKQELKQKKAVKIRASAGGGQTIPGIHIWSDNDASDEPPPRILSCVVYHDKGRGAFPTLEAKRGQLNGESLIALANQIPIKGGNVMNAGFDATALRVWVSYASAGQEA
jgi:isopenicillin-N N-acyltransferase-like protein